MKKREELTIFKTSEETKEILELLKDTVDLYDFETEIPPLLKMDLMSIAGCICEMSNDENSKEDRIEFFLKAISTINNLSPTLFLLMMDVGIKDIFDVNENGTIVLKEEYNKKVDHKVLGLNDKE